MLEKLFAPAAIALIGASATPGKLGFSLLANLINSGYFGKVFPVNPKATEILGKKTFSSVLEIPDEVDLALIAVPATAVAEVLEECGQKKIQNVVIISAGFKESGEEGAEREEQVRQIAARHKMNLIGPNCLGILNPHFELNASFAEGMPRQGNIGLISQSGAMIVAIADWAAEENLGFSKIVSLGNKAGLTENELLEYLGNDPETEVILLYLESFADGQKFMALARKISAKKPIIVFKAGNSEAGAKAVSSHTGSLAGSGTAVKTALRQCGVIQAETLEDFFDYAQSFSLQPLPRRQPHRHRHQCRRSRRDRHRCRRRIRAVNHGEIYRGNERRNSMLPLPAAANTANPVDVIGDALADRYRVAFEAVLADPEVNMLLTILTPQVMTEKEATVKILHEFAEKYPQKTFLTSFMGGKNLSFAEEKLAEYKIPNFLSPNRAVECLEKMVWLSHWRMTHNQPLASELRTPNSQQIELLRQKITREKEKGRNQINPSIVSELLETYGISIASSQLARSADGAVKIASDIGYPVVLKIASDQILHKTDAGGVRLALKNEEEVRRAFNEISENIAAKFPGVVPDGIMVQKMHHFGRETIIGFKRDPVFGPLVMFGLGGIYVEVLKDVAFRIAPLNAREAEAMIHEVKAVNCWKACAAKPLLTSLR